MKNVSQLSWLLILVLACSSILFGQAPSGSVSGTVYDETGAVIANALVIIKNKDTGAERRIASGADGVFNAPALQAGLYEVRVEMKGFRTQVREATVEVGSATTADARLSVGAATEVVTVEAATAQISYESNSIDGVVTRKQIQELPLNGRSFLNLAFLEPGVRVNTGSTSQYNAQFSVSILGADAGRTSYNVDGGNVRDNIESTGSSQNFSQEVVQEFQLSSVNFDLSTGITAVGSVNIVTRSGGNDFHGSGYFFFRDYNMAAYPALKRNALAPNPFFARRNPGFWVGGPIIKNKLFFFFNYEYQNQLSAVPFQPNLPSFAALQATYFSPYKGKTLSARFDYRLNDKHTLFARYSHDGNRSLGPSAGAQYPSNWVVNANHSDQSILGVTSSLKTNLVNDFRFSYQYWHNRNLFPTESDCPGCIGIGSGGVAGQLGVSGGNITVGHSTNATQGRDLRKFQFTDGATWQKGTHRIRFGGEYEHAPGTGFWGYCDPFCGQVASPELARSIIPLVGAPTFNALFPTLPTSVRTYADFLNLPFLGAVIGVGDPSQPPPYNIDKAKPNDRIRFYYQDAWRISPKFTLQYGLAWNYESNLVNKDLPKPAFLQPFYGSDLSATKTNKLNFSPALGFTWNPFKNSKTVFRGGMGVYYDTEYLYQRLQERAVIGPVGNGRQQFPSTGLTNIFPGIVNFSLGGVPIPVGGSLTQGLSNLTTAQFLQIYNQQIGAINNRFRDTGNKDLSVRNINLSKSGAQLYPRDYPTLQSVHFNFGFQREIRRDMVLTVDYARRVFNHVTDQTTFDFNRFNRFVNGVRAPVIPVCTPAQASNPAINCSTGAISFWVPGFRTVYNGMLVKLDKRFAQRYQFTASYALQNQHGNNGLINGDNWNQSYGPQGSRHVLNISGIVDLKYGFNLGIISATSSVGPAMVFVNNYDAGGSTGGTASSALPGLDYNCINRGCGKDDVIRAVNDFNTNISKNGTAKDVRGNTISALALPSTFDFGRTFQSQDIRLTWGHTLKEKYKFTIFAEMFNVLNYQNLGGVNTTIDAKTANSAAQTFAFGQYTQRAGQVFGSGGPRALQVGARFQF